MPGRASIVGAAATHVGKVREHNEDSHYFDADGGVFLVCDGMGGHAAGEVASALAIRTIRAKWNSNETQNLITVWLTTGTPEAKKHMLASLRDGVLAAHDVIIAEAAEDEAKTGMGTTLVGAMIVGNELVFAHAGDSRAYLVRDAIAMQLTEDHTLLSRLLAAGIEVDVSGEGARFRSMLTNALGIGNECKVSTFVVPLADGDRFMFCSDGVTEYVKEAEVGEVLSKQPSPARAAQKLIDLALDRGGGDNATTIVMRVLEAGDSPQPAEALRREEAVIAKCPLWGTKVNPQQRLRALRIAIQRDQPVGERIPAITLGDRVAWILVEGKVVQDGGVLDPGALIYPESLVRDSQLPDRDGLAVARTDVRLLALRADDFHEICDDDPELGEALLEALQPLIARRRERRDTEIDLALDDGDAAVIVSKAPERLEASTQQASVAGEIFTRTKTEDRPKPPPPPPESLDKTVEKSFEAVIGGPGATPSPSASQERSPLILTPRIAAPTPTPRASKIVPAVEPPPMTPVPAPAPKAGPKFPRPETPRPTARPSQVKLPPVPGLKIPARTTSLGMPVPPIPTSRTPTESELAARRAPAPPPKRPPTEPEIEAQYELEAEEPPGPPPISIEPDDEPTNVRPLSEPLAASASRAKRLSEGWDD